MNLKEFANTGVSVPELAQGTWQYRGGVAPLRMGIERGASFVDTAEGYGNELLVGQAIQGLRDRVFLASKVSPRHFRYKDVIRAAECSLKRLKTDFIDLYQLHWPNYTIPLAETMAGMERLVEMGKVRFIGVSNFSVTETERAQSYLSRTRIASNQVRYSLLDRTAERHLLPYCEANQISLLAYSPLGTSLGNLLNADMGDALGRIAAALGKSRAQVALNWCACHPAVITIFKAEKLEHVEENCAASGWTLTEEQRRLLSEGVTARQNRSPLNLAVRRLARRAMQQIGRDLGVREE